MVTPNAPAIGITEISPMMTPADQFTSKIDASLLTLMSKIAMKNRLDEVKKYAFCLELALSETICPELYLSTYVKVDIVV
jgi:hypothetical protein